jgi:hypothetical protein
VTSRATLRSVSPSPAPPGHLSASSQRLWWRVLENYLLEDHHRELLRLALESLARLSDIALCQMCRRCGFAHPVLSRCYPEPSTRRATARQFVTDTRLAGAVSIHTTIAVEHVWTSAGPRHAGAIPLTTAGARFRGLQPASAVLRPY